MKCFLFYEKLVCAIREQEFAVLRRVLTMDNCSSFKLSRGTPAENAVRSCGLQNSQEGRHVYFSALFGTGEAFITSVLTAYNCVKSLLGNRDKSLVVVEQLRQIRTRRHSLEFHVRKT